MSKYEFWQNLRIKNNLTQQELATMFNVTKQMISSFEKGNTKSRPLQKKYLTNLSNDEKYITLGNML